MTSKLASLLQQSGIQNVQERIHHLKFTPGTPDQEVIYEDMKFVFRATIPFLSKWTRLPDDFTKPSINKRSQRCSNQTLSQPGTL